MKLNAFTKYFSTAKRWVALACVSLAAIAFLWQGAFLFDNTAIAAPVNLTLAADLGDKVQDKNAEEMGKAKGFIRDTANKVERTAKKNAERVDNATDDDSPIAERAKNDAGRIKQNAERDAARTQKAVDNSKNAIEKAVDNVKDAFGQ
jgi:hypothetical protein